MKKSRFCEQQIAFILRQAEEGAPGRPVDVATGTDTNRRALVSMNPRIKEPLGVTA